MIKRRHLGLVLGLTLIAMRSPHAALQLQAPGAVDPPLSIPEQTAVTSALACVTKLLTRFCESPQAATRRRLADDPAHVQRMGLQSARSDQRWKRQAPSAGVDDVDRHEQRARGGADRQRRRDVRLDARSTRCSRSTRRRATCLWRYRSASPGNVRGKPVNRGVALYGDKVFVVADARPCSSRSTRKQARKSGERRSATTPAAST